MTGRELYEKDRRHAQELGVILPPWEALTPWRQANWNASAAEHTKKLLNDLKERD